MAQIIQVHSQNQIETTARIAKEIWTQHYEPIIGIDQVNYMIDKFQSKDAIRQQIEDHYEYYLLEDAGHAVGYLSIQLQGDCLFLSKIYVDRRVRGKGFGKLLVQKTETRATELGAKSIRLTVNKYNENSIRVYEKLGFENRRALVADIGNGFVMDDFEFVKTL